MAYVPPHKRVSKTEDGPPPTPALMIPQFKKSLNLNHSSRRGFYRRMVYANNSISTWLAAPSLDDVQHPSSFCLVPVCLDSMGLKTGEEQFILVNDNLKGHHDIKSCDFEHMWTPVAEIVHADLLSVFEKFRNELDGQNLEESKPKVVARFGKVHFRRNRSTNLEIQGNPVSECYVKNLRRVFNANVPIGYTEHIKKFVIPELGVQYVEEKDLHYMKLADAKRADFIISCKCRVLKDENKIELYKIELSHVRYLIEDISCLESNVDLRFAVCTKKNLNALQDEEVQRIKDLISSAMFDPHVKNGLKWPVGKTDSGGQYSVVQVLRIKTEVFENSSMKLKVREADHFDNLGTTGEFTREISVALIDLTKNLLEQRCEAGSTMALLEDALKLIQNHFLAWDSKSGLLQ